MHLLRQPESQSHGHIEEVDRQDPITSTMSNQLYDLALWPSGALAGPCIPDRDRRVLRGPSADMFVDGGYSPRILSIGNVILDNDVGSSGIGSILLTSEIMCGGWIQDRSEAFRQ
jgi:hypothetical protein